MTRKNFLWFFFFVFFFSFLPFVVTQHSPQFIEIGLLIREKKKKKTSRPHNNNIKQNMGEEKEEEQTQQKEVHKKEKDPLLLTIEKLFRLFSVLVWWAFSVPALYVLSPIRLLSPLFRAFHVPNHLLPLDVLGKLQCWVTIYLLGITAEVVDLREKTPEGSMIVMGNHVSFLDPMVMSSYCSGAPKFIMKKELLYNPIGFMCWLLGHVPIDRSNREKALKSIAHAMKKIKRDQRSIVIFPEGTRSANGKLQSFKKGGFHMASNAGIPIQPVIICNAYELLPRKQKLPIPGRARLYLLPLVPVQKGEDVNSLLVKVHEIMLTAQEKFASDPPPQLSLFDRLPLASAFVIGAGGFLFSKIVSCVF